MEERVGMQAESTVFPARDRTVEELVEGLFTDHPPVEDSSMDDHFLRNEARVAELQSDRKTNCDNVADVVIRALIVREMMGTLRKEDSGSGLYHALKVLDNLAESRHEKMVAGILYWDEIYEREDRSERDILVKILKRIGTPEHAVPALKYFARHVKEVSYTPMPPWIETECWDDGEGEPQPIFVEGPSPEQLKAEDQEMVEYAISHIRERRPSTK